MPCRGRISGPGSSTKCTQTDPGTKKMEIVCCSGLQASLKKIAVIGLWLPWLVVTSLWSLLPLVVYGPDPPCRRIQRPIFRLKEHPVIQTFEILTVVTAAVTVFRNMTPCNLVNRQRYSVGSRQLTAGLKRYNTDKCRNLIVRYTNFYFIIVTIKDN
jgi:hypothetical protein